MKDKNVKWEKVKLGDISIINPKIQLPTDNNQKIGFIAMADVSNSGKISNIQERKLGEVINKGFTRFQTKDVLFAKITPCMENGKGGICTDNQYAIYLGSTEFHVLRATYEILPKYLYYIVNNPMFRTIAERKMTGSAGQKRVPADFLANYTLLLPPKKTQEKIVKIMSLIDKKIELSSQIVTKTEVLRQGLMNDILTGKIRID